MNKRKGGSKRMNNNALHKRKKGTKNKRKGGTLEGVVDKRTKGKHGKRGTNVDKKHTHRIAKMYESGELTSGQEIPLDVLDSFSSDTYVPSEPTEEYIPWSSLPPDVVEELHANIPEIKNILKSGVIRPEKGVLSKEERAIINEKKLVSSPHSDHDTWSRHYVVPRDIPRGPLPIPTYKNELLKTGRAIGWEHMGCNVIDTLSVDPCRALLPFQVSVLQDTSIYNDVCALFSRIKATGMKRYTKEYITELIQDIEDNLGIQHVETTPSLSMSVRFGSDCFTEDDKPKGWVECMALKSSVYYVVLVFKLDTNGRYYVSVCVPCYTVFHFVRSIADKKCGEKTAVIEKDHRVHKQSKKYLEYMFHTCTCK